MKDIVRFPNHPIWSGGFLGEFPLFTVGNLIRVPSILDPIPPPQKPVLIDPVPLAFRPSKVITIDDRKDHEGVSFAELWADPVARTLWLGHKRFMITSQYFRLCCIQQGNELRRRPQKLLQERVGFVIEHRMLWPEPWLYDIGGQLTPYLIWALQREGKWPYHRMPVKELGWIYAPKGAKGEKK